MARVAVAVVVLFCACGVPDSSGSADASEVADAGTSCVPGSQRCEGDAVKRCNEAGEAWETSELCERGCDPGETGTTPRCTTCLCTPGASRCVPGTNALETCNAGCLAWVVQQCGERARCSASAAGERETAACKTCLVEPTDRCDGTAIVRIGPSCEEFVVEHCEFGCDADGCHDAPFCTANATRCDGDSVKRCNAIGSFEATERCEGLCHETSAGAACVSCVPNEVTCGEGGTIRRCRSDGSGHEVLMNCTAGCLSDAQGVRCASE